MAVRLLAADPHDDALRAAVRPRDWSPPTPADRYNLVVLGGGPAGLIAALGAAGMGARVALVERRTVDGLTGYCRVWADRRGRIHGATIVADDAGELLAPVTLAMTHGLGLRELAATIPPYPTRSELVARVAAEWNRSRLTPRIAALARWFLAWRR